MTQHRIDLARMVALPRISRPEGNITPVEGGRTMFYNGNLRGRTGFGYATLDET